MTNTTNIAIINSTLQIRRVYMQSSTFVIKYKACYISSANTLYKEWKATTDEQEYLMKKRNFRTFDNIVEKRKLEIKQEYYYDTFQAQKTDLKKSWGTLNEALNRNKQKIDLPSEFIYKNKAITDRVEIANSFNEYFVNIGPNLSEKSILQ